MKFSEKWLREYVNPSLTTQALCDRLTLAGLEVDSVEPVAAHFSSIVVGQIQTIAKHPNADKLNICQVDVGQPEFLNIVCGAPNVYKGMKAPVALVGAVLPGDFKIKASKLRGEPSFGMMCSEKELGLSEGHGGLMDLPKDAPVGVCLREYLDLDDVSIEVDLTPNRADCLSVFGIAREVSALTGTPLDKSLHMVSNGEICETSQDQVTVEIKAKEACPQYLGRIIRGVNTQAHTPLWMREKLRRSGLRSISFVVDVTNFVLLELGQPMHAFDAAKVHQGIIVRNAHAGEKLQLLDESEVTLDQDDLVIADHNQALALAGIMGGLSSSVTDETVDILLESAHFSPISMAGKARKYGLHTDSSHRFERGVDSQLPSIAMEYATQLILQIAGGQVGPVTLGAEVNSEHDRDSIKLRANQVNSILGYDFEVDYIEQTLKRLGLVLNSVSHGEWKVVPPSYRFDIAIEEDLIEEVGRVYGYENLPEKLPELSMHVSPVSDQCFELDKAKQVLANRGFHEVINYSFIEPRLNDLFFKQDGIELQNPISLDMSVMRQGLIPGLMSAFKSNANRQQDRVRIFEEGVIFNPEEQGHSESVRLGGLVYGQVNALNWCNNDKVDFYTLKSDVEMLLSATEKTFEYQPVLDCVYLHPGKSASIMLEGKCVGFIGVVHPNVMKGMSIKGQAPIVFELDWEKISQKEVPRFKQISKFPSISRDLALILDADMPVQILIESIKTGASELLQEIRVFDVYQGDNLHEDKKSVAVNLILQDSSETLNEEKISKVVSEILAKVKLDAGATLRE